ncbi:glycine cleavage system aminomethyltransferase GcvT [Oculatella sp. LEGE 06141]|uniref:glycine cleavage system aminomethyltransferase GcvT n=1 Tax=Oculatella sp. LEGE 06141 TaxID=1828648 RepID=UPI0030DABD8C
MAKSSDLAGLPISPLQRTPLYELYAESKARITPFSGWEMPVQYEGITKEHQAVRQQVGMFDISHMGKFKLKGATVLEQLQYLVPSDLEHLQPGEAQYTVLLNEQAGIIDDLIIYYQGADTAGIQDVMIIANAATTAKDRDWLLSHLDQANLVFEDRSPTQVLLAIQGPEAAPTFQPFVEHDLATVGRFGHFESNVLGKPAFVARTGYTGEDGFEVMLDPGAGIELWRSLLAAGVTPCGLGARDTLRLEAAMALYGQDIDETTTPLEAGLGWLVHLDRNSDFMGRAVLAEQKQFGVARRLVGIRMEGRNIARHGYPILYKQEAIGTVTSGTLSPTLGYAIALAYVPTHLARVDQALEVEIRGKTYPATVTKRPFYKRTM